MNSHDKISEILEEVISDNQNNLSETQRERLADLNNRLKGESKTQQRAKLAADILKVIILIEEVVRHIT